MEELLTENSPYSLKYNVEVICSQILPSNGSLSNHFISKFLEAGGIDLLTSVLNLNVSENKLIKAYQRSLIRTVLRMLNFLLWDGIEVKFITHL